MQSRPKSFEHSLQIEKKTKSQMEKTEKENILRPLVCISQTYILLLDRTHNVMHENRWLKWWRSFGKKWNNKDARLFSPIIFGTNRKIFSASATSMAILIQWISISNTGFLSHESILAIRFSRTFFFVSTRNTQECICTSLFTLAFFPASLFVATVWRHQAFLNVRRVVKAKTYKL